MGIGIHTFSGEPTPHSLFKASNTPGSFNRVSLAFTILGLLDLIYSYADLAEKWRPENGKISFKKNLDLFMWQKWKMPTPGGRINMKEREDIMRMSLFPWGFQFTLESVTQLTHRESFSQNHWETRKNVRKLLWHAGSKLLNFSNKRLLKKTLNAGSKHYHTCKKSRVPHSTNHECVWAKCFSWNKESFFLRKWAIIIISKVLFNFVLIHSKFSIYKNILA